MGRVDEDDLEEHNLELEVTNRGRINNFPLMYSGVKIRVFYEDGCYV